jgi:hypothetical protein
MMVENALFNLLNGLVGGRMYPMVAPDSPTVPFIVYQNITNSPEYTLGNTSPINNTRMQIDCYSDTYGGVKSLVASVQSAMQAAAQAKTLVNVPKMSSDLYEAEVKLYRVTQDYSIWY